MEPIGAPSPSSVTNNSPSPPSVTLDAPTASPTLSSGSAPGTTGGTRGPGQSTAAGKSRLTIQSLDQRPVELLDGVVDVRIRVRAGNEPCLEGRGREEHAAGEGCSVPPGETRRIRVPRLGEVPHRAGGEVRAPHRAGVARGHGHPVPRRGVPYTRDEPRGSPLQRLVKPRALRLAQRREARRHRDRVSRERAGLVDRRSEEHTSELQSPCNLVCRLLLEKKKQTMTPRLPHVPRNRESSGRTSI